MTDVPSDPPAVDVDLARKGRAEAAWSREDDAALVRINIEAIARAVDAESRVADLEAGIQALANGLASQKGVDLALALLIRDLRALVGDETPEEERVYLCGHPVVRSHLSASPDRCLNHVGVKGAKCWRHVGDETPEGTT